ncbi:hypothetical protein DsansV1_C27g0203091 [Dioscorea sansibarensis]
MSSNFTPISSGETTAETKLLSYSSLARLCSFVKAFWKLTPVPLALI